jgi:hypothetical protein
MLRNLDAASELWVWNMVFPHFKFRTLHMGAHVEIYGSFIWYDKTY